MADVALAAILDARGAVCVVPADDRAHPVRAVPDEASHVRDAPSLRDEPEDLPVAALDRIVGVTIALGELIRLTVGRNGRVAGHGSIS